jgi:hypothetical protein
VDRLEAEEVHRHCGLEAVHGGTKPGRIWQRVPLAQTLEHGQQGGQQQKVDVVVVVILREQQEHNGDDSPEAEQHATLSQPWPQRFTHASRRFAPICGRHSFVSFGVSFGQFAGKSLL